jgi:hypothetical protein
MRQRQPVHEERPMTAKQSPKPKEDAAPFDDVMRQLLRAKPQHKVAKKIVKKKPNPAK